MKQIILIVLGILISSFSFGQTENTISKNVANILFEKTKDLPENTEFSIAFIINDKVSYYGFKRVNDTIDYTENSKKVFEIGSITKVFTSTILANFVLDQKIGINNPIQDYFDFPLKNQQIKVIQLANHTSGLPRLPSNLNLREVDQSNPYNEYNEDKLKDYLTNELELDSLAGSNYEYSNLGAGILGFLLEIQAGSDYETLLKKYITEKYGMNNTTTNIKKVQENLIKGRDSIGNETSNWNLNALMGAGGILSNVEDLAKFTIAQFNTGNKELALTRKSTFEIPKYRMEVGLAWNIIKPEPKLTWYMHNGGTGGYSSIMAMDTENKIGIIILSNVSSFHNKARNIDQLCLGLMQNQYKK
ncbi:beta-lactamase family protein [Winogradskyella sp. DF17]|uniref:Beta-lactamase family protein n=1 Tax=Winogradskyella pelagia TaxID=2819984 RepID=A0ABS3T7Z7_9FLAO|nr:serine hydrolase domain-containing protein [Winogradskyella sp. DF17]MBO3118016.1 beta-lactamase family protein [Winogradskyella sp. DF17]